MADRYCCAGCAAVHAALSAQGLSRFYALRGRVGPPVAVRETSTTWLMPVVESLAASGGTQSLSFGVQGIHCSGCVWLLERLFARLPGASRMLVNPSAGRLDLRVEPHFPLQEFARELASFGYVIGASSERSEAAQDGLLVRLGVSVALALNSMVLSAALYLGLRDGPLFTLFHQLNFAMGSVSVVVGGGYFVRTAWQAARRGLLHFDQPIAVGIVLAFVGSCLALWRGSDGVYFDTLCTFVALMLAGRWLQERVLARNRRFLLQDDGLERLPIRRVVEDHVQWTRCGAVQAGDQLLIAPGDLLPIAARLLDDTAQASLQWIDGELSPRRFSRGQTLPAGAFNASRGALRATALDDFSASPLRDLLGAPRHTGRGQSGPFWTRLTRAYVLLVLGTAATACATWWLWAGPDRALSVATAVLVVTCPCAFGIATPLAYDLVLSRLRRAGLFVRGAELLDRACDVRQIVFDKTGTLTTGALHLVEQQPLQALSRTERGMLFQLAVRSSHPKARAVQRALEATTDAHPEGLALLPGLFVEEVTGRGVRATHLGQVWTLGAPDWAATRTRTGTQPADVVFARDGSLLAALSTFEQPRPDAEHEIRQLTAAGYDLWILSGDSLSRTRELAERISFPVERVVADQRPHQKAQWLKAHRGHHTLMLGDGVNDAPAMRVALCGGTPAVDRPFMPARTDFYFITAGLGPIRIALKAAHSLRSVVRGNLTIAVLYNISAVALAVSGHMAPWIAAVSMPLSSLAVIGWTLHRLPTGGASWRS